MAEQVTHRPTILFQVDLDSLWAIRQVYGLSQEDDFASPDPVYDLAVRRFLDLFDSRGVRGTFFVIGRDCQVASRARLLAEIAARGHEIANHSHTHPIEIGSLSADAVRDEILAAQEAIRHATGAAPRGFRAPGYNLSDDVLRAVKDAGLAYDASLLPTRLGGVLRAVAGLFRRGPRRTPGSRGQYGASQARHAPVEPYLVLPSDPWRPCAVSSLPDAVLEIPVAVTPRLRLPLHGSVAIAVGWPWTRRALDAVCRSSRVVAYVLHGIDLLGGNEAPGLPRGFLGRRIFLRPYAQKRRTVERIVDFLIGRGDVVLSRDFAAEHSSEKA